MASLEELLSGLTCEYRSGPSGRSWDARKRSPRDDSGGDIKLHEITSAYYFNFVDCLTAVTPRIRVRNSRQSFLRIISPKVRARSVAQSTLQPFFPSHRQLAASH